MNVVNSKICSSIAFLILLFSFSASAGIIEGYVKDSESMQPISGVTVELTDTNLTTTTDVDGYYSFFDDTPTPALYRDQQGKLYSPMQSTLVSSGKIHFLRSVAMASIFQLSVFDLRGNVLFSDFISCESQYCSMKMPNSTYSGVAVIRLSEYGAITETSRSLSKRPEPEPLPEGTWNISWSKTGYNSASSTITEGTPKTTYLNPIPSPGNFTWTPDDCHFYDNSVTLANLVNDYRQENGLHRIPLSGHLFLVAELHTRDLYFHDPDGLAECNLHSWSDQSDAFGYNWSAVCYNSNDDTTFPHMWDKPKQISAGAYTSRGYENAAAGAGTPEGFLNLWKSSPAHNAVILQTGMWESHPWQALGASIYQNHAVLWFADDTDSKPLTLCPIDHGSER